MTTKIIMPNGHVLVLEPDTEPDVADKVGQQYINLLASHVEAEHREHIARLLMVLLIPLIPFFFFAYLGRILWVRLSRVA